MGSATNKARFETWKTRDDGVFQVEDGVFRVNATALQLAAQEIPEDAGARTTYSSANFRSPAWVSTSFS
jgi:hypothetical protein